MSLHKISEWFQGIGAAATNRKNRRRRQMQRRRILASEQLENRRLMVADLVNFLTQEHVDINIQHTSGVWNLGPRNSDATPEIQYANDEAVMYVGAPALTARPAGTTFDFVGVPAGSNFYLLPQSQNSDLLYLGFAAYGVSSSTVDRYTPTTESKGRVGGNARWVKASLAEVRHTTPNGSVGDGAFSLWQTGSFGDPTVYMSSYNDSVSNPNGAGLDVTDGVSADDAMWIVTGGHAHFNFGFTQPGRYEVDLKLSAYFGDDGLTTPNTGGYSESEKITVYFSVISVGQLEVDESSYTVNEDAGTVSMDVVRVGGSDGRITVNYATSNGSAQAGSDYAATSGTLEFLDGETRKTVVVSILNDTVEESSETFSLVLSNPKPDNIDDYRTVTEGDSNGLLGAVSTAVVTILDNDQNTAPTISDVTDKTTDEDTPTGAIGFTVGDTQTAADALVVTVSSNNTTLVPNANIVLGGSGANRTVVVTPAPDLFGTATITLTVTDAGGLSSSDSFVLTVNSVNDAPTISDVANQVTDLNTPTGAIAFTIGDIETAAGSLMVSASSSNTAVVPNANIALGGTGANRTITLTPAANISGHTTITLTVTDAEGRTATDTFVLSVGVNESPTISAIADRYVLEGNSTGAIPFTVGDAETAAGDLVVTASSSNQSVIPDGNIVLGGSGANRTISLTSVLDQIGPTTITVTVTDIGGVQTSETFVLTVTANGLVPFEVAVGYPGVVATRSNTLVSADFNGDGKLDLVSGGGLPGSLALLKGNGDSTFQSELAVNAGSPFYVGRLFAADYDNDGDIDLLTGEYDLPTVLGTATNGQVAVHLNDGNGNFSRQTILSGLAQVPTFIQAGDMNGDGRPDIIHASNATTLVYYESLPGGGYASPEVLSGSFTSLSATALRLDDIDADGDRDILVYDTTPRTLSIFRNDGVGNFGAPQQLTFAAATSVRAVADITGDGLPDIVTTDSATVYYAQISNGTFGARTDLQFGAGGNMLATDLNQDGVTDLIVNQSSSLYWASGRGNGTFGQLQLLKASLFVANTILTRDFDGDGDIDIATGSSASGTPVWINKNLTGENPMRFIPPASRTYMGGDRIEMQVSFGFPITVTGTPRIAMQLGLNTVYANYVSGSGSQTLLFRYTVGANDVDLDGVELITNVIDLNGGTLTDPEGGAALLTFPATTFSGVVVNAPGPFVQSVTRLDPRTTSADTVRFAVQFSEDVTGVDVADFALRMTEGDLSGAMIQSVTGSGSLYQVTVSTGTGSGALGLSVPGTASISDLNGDVFSREYIGGEIYTVRQAPIGNIDAYYTDAHADYRPRYNNGEFSYVWHGDPGVLPQIEYPSNEVITYLDSTSIVNRPAGANYDFLGVGAGQPVYLSNSSGNIASVPYLGFSGESLARGIFAGNPTLQLVGMRSSNGGDFSIYSVNATTGAVTIRMATSNGISSSDFFSIPVASHSHFNTAFSKVGTYEVDVIIAGYLDTNKNGTLETGFDTYVESGIQTMVFHVDTLGAVNDSFNVGNGSTLTGSVALNDDWHASMGAYTASVETTTSQGTLTLQPNGSFTYQPSATFNGSDSFTYRLTNERGGFTTATVTITGSTRPDFDAVIKSGHTDIGVNFEDDAWDLHIHDEENDIEYEPDGALLYVGRDAMLTRSGDAANAAYDFLGAPVGSTLFVLPEVENPNLPFLGIGAEELADGLLEGDVASLRLASVSGPGHFSIWQSGLTPTTPKLVMATSDGIDASDVYEAAAGSHAHMNFAFTKQGFYEVTFVAMGIDADGNATNSGQVTYYFDVNDGLVPFALPKVIGSGLAGVSNVNTADFDSDGKLDVLAGAYGANKVVWFKGNGDGTFGTERVIDSAAAETWFNTPGDLDGDGDIDVLVGMYSGTLAWYANNGSGEFTKNVLATDMSGPYVRIGDLNGDGRNDILAGPDGGTTIFYFQQLSTGGFAPSQVIASSFSKLGGIHLSDFDFDGDLDVFAGDYGSNQLSWFVNNAGVLGARQFVSGQNFSGLDRMVDLTGDGRVDMLSLEYGTGKVSYYPQLPGGSFGDRVAVPLNVADSYALAVADFDNDGDNDIADGAYGSQAMIAWVANTGNGAFEPQLEISRSEGQVSSMTTADLDGDGDVELIVGSFSAGHVSIYTNRRTEFATEVVAPATGIYLLGQKLDTSVHFGYPVTVTGIPSISLQVGSQTVQATYHSGSGTPTLKFQYTTQGADLDLDGVQLASLLIALNGGSIINPLGNPVDLTLPAAPFSGVVVNGNAPFATSITRGGAVHGANTPQVSFLVSFNEAVQDADAGDFALVTTGTLAGTSIASVSGTGSSRTIVVNTGTGSGALGLRLKSNATITDLSGNAIGRGYAGGEVFTIQRSPSFVIDNFYTAGHGDVQAAFEDEWLGLKVTPDGFEYENDEVLIYGNADALTTRPAGSRWDFLGVDAGQSLYLWSDNGAIPTVPEQGFSGELIPGGTVAAHPVVDPRIANTGTYVRLQVIALRSTQDGAYSVYTNDLETTRVWIATADGISSADSIWIQEGSHQHFNVAFSKNGYYEVDFVVSTFQDVNGNGVYDEGLDPYIESGIETIFYGVDIPGGPVDYVVRSDNTPVAGADEYSVAPGNRLYGNVLLNDSDIDGETLNVVAVSGVTKGTLVLNSDGTFTYTPGATFNGNDSFTYRATDGSRQSVVTTVTITGSTRPDFEVLLESGHTDIGLAIGEHGRGNGGFDDEAAWDLHIHDEENDIEYRPDEALLYVKPEAEMIRQGGAAAPAFDFLGVAPGESFFVLPETENPDLLFLGIGGEEIAAGTLLGGAAKLQLVAVSGPGAFSVWNSGSPNPLLRMATFDGITVDDYVTVPEGSHSHLNFAFSKKGEYEVTFLAIGSLADGTEIRGENVTYFFRVGNDAPQTVDDTFAVHPGNALQGNVLFNDFDPNHDALTSQVLTTPSKGTLTLRPDGSFVYTPSLLFDGADSFSYRASDAFGGTIVGNVTITEAIGRSFDVHLATGHVDIGLALSDQEWDLHIHDEETDTEYHPDEAQLQLNAVSRTIRTGPAADPAFDFVGVAPGNAFYMLPQIQNVNQLFLGIAAEEVVAGTFMDGNAKLQLISVNGPGEFSIWNNEVSGPIVRMASFDGINESDFVTILEGGHSHFNYAFSQLGSYEITVQASGILADGTEIVSDYVTYFFSVGNIAPSLDHVSDVTVSEDAGLQQISLTSITAGAGENQPLRITASSSNASLIPNVVVNYSSPNSIGNLQFTPAPNLSGVSTITLTIEDGGLDDNLNTTADNGQTIYTFDIIVDAINDAPTLSPISGRDLLEDAAEQTVNLEGISAGGDETQNLRVSATSSNPALVPNPSVQYTSPATAGTIRFTPVADQSGSAIITVTVEDGGLDNDLSTLGDNGTVSQSFTVVVNAVNDSPTLDPISNLSIDEDAAEQSISLTGISAGGSESQPLSIVVTSSNQNLIPNPALDYVSGNPTGTLRFTPTANMFGTAVITVTITDGGLDNDLGTTAGNLSFTRSFVITVLSVNDQPIAANDSYQILINAMSDLNVLQNDSDVEDSNSNLTIQIVTQPSGGTVVVNNGQIRFIPNITRLGADSFTYRTVDTAGGVSDVATVNLVLSETPKTNGDSYWLAKNQSYIANVLANDTYLLSPLQSSSLALTNVSPTGAATVQNGKVLVTPTSGYIGAITFTYTVANQLGVVSSPASVTVNVLDRSFQNPQRRFDVNGDFFVTAIDALIIINNLNRLGSRELSVLTDFTPPYLDVNGDFFVSATDALAVINHLNAQEFGGAGEAEGEASGMAEMAPATTIGNDAHSSSLQESFDLQDYVDSALIEMLAEEHHRRQKATVKR